MLEKSLRSRNAHRKHGLPWIYYAKTGYTMLYIGEAMLIPHVSVSALTICSVKMTQIRKKFLQNLNFWQNCWS